MLIVSFAGANGSPESNYKFIMGLSRGVWFYKMLIAGFAGAGSSA